MLADVTAMTGVEAETRRYAAKWNSKGQLGAVAIVGAGMPIRVIASLLTRAITMLHQRRTVPIEFLKEEAEARRWLAAHTNTLGAA